MKEHKFYDILNRIALINLIGTVLFSGIVFLFNMSIINGILTVIPICIKLILWAFRGNIDNIEESNDKTILIITMCAFTLFFSVDSLLYNNFLPAAVLLIVPIFAVTLKKNLELIKMECIITFIFMVVLSTVNAIITPFKVNLLTNILFFIIAFVQLILIIKQYTEEALTISAKSDFFLDKSKRDGATGIYNNSTFYDAVTEKVQLMAPFCIIIINIDSFKTVKDTYGQPFGDYVLKSLVKIIKKTIREQDTAYRYVGEDIAVIFPKSTDDEAFVIAEKIRNNFREKTYDHNADWLRTKRPITISIGLIENNIRGAIPQELIEKCDQALFYSKQHGKNQTTIYHEHILEWEDKFDDFRRKYRDYKR